MAAVLGLSFSSLSAGTHATGQQPTPEPLPLPQEADVQAPPALVVLPLPGYYRDNRYDVWQYYGVDRFGRWRPRVALAPPAGDGSYYLINGKPYPWVSTHQLDFMPYVTD